MNYEIVELEEKRVVGISARTSNGDPDMGSIIGGLWQRFYGEGIYAKIAHKKNDVSIGLYNHYESNATGSYDVTVCCEVTEDGQNPEDIMLKTISAGKYAKFIVRGHMQKACYEFWSKLWAMDLNRRFDCDFEEYQSGGDMENCEIHFYISLA